MLYFLLCNCNITSSTQARNADKTVKHVSKIFSPKTSGLNRIQQKKIYRVLHTNNKLHLKQHEVLNNFSFASLKYAYIYFKNHCLHCAQCRSFVPNRCNSTSARYQRWKKTYSVVASYLPSSFFKKLRYIYTKKTSKFGLSYASPNQEHSNHHVLDFPNFFKKNNSLNLRPHTTLDSSEKTIKIDKTEAHSSTPFDVNFDSSQSELDLNKPDKKVSENLSEENISKESDLKESNSELNQNLITKSTQRSQYEHLITSLSTQEAEVKTEEKSAFSSIRSLVEIPVNSFFSFLSRSNVLEKESSAISVNDKLLPSPEKEIVDSAESKEVDTSPKSVIETLYQYVPYVFSTSPKTSEENANSLKEKEIIRLKAEKELLHQKININNRTRYLLHAISESISLFNLSQHVDELKDHLLRFPDTRIAAIRENGVQAIMNVYCTTTDEDLRRSTRMILAMFGSVDPPKMKGIRLLTIDGGGSRGIAAVEICKKIVELTGRPINETFDYICGVSTGAILGFALGVLKMPVDELGNLYRDLSTDIFNQNRLVGTGNLVLSHAYYNTESYQKLMKNIFGNQLLIETAAIEDVPKCSAVSTLANRLPLKPFLWRNYSIVPGTRHTHWSGTCRATMWEAVRASSAAPGYFEEFKKGYNIHQDGGVLTNNPTGVALNECRLLWPHAPIQCVVSVGTGRYEPVIGPVGEEFSSLKDKLLKFVDSATNVTEIHKVMYDLLPAGSYFRFNPFLDEPLLLDEYRPEKMDMLVENTINYTNSNDYKFRACAAVLMNKKM